jgi:hypothetical protein
MPMYRKRPVVIEARQLGHGYDEDIAIAHWSGARTVGEEDDADGQDAGSGAASQTLMVITTKEGEMRASAGDWIIKGTQGEFYPCKPEIFQEIYEET